MKEAKEGQEILDEGNSEKTLLQKEQERFWSSKKRKLETRGSNEAKAIEAHTKELTELVKEKEEVTKDLRLLREYRQTGSSSQ